ncbi:glycogen debranching protein [Bordetella sp. H567]|uniref:amylo-alpha-1,6-glucosidase n=1 Tax=Bordetella sp. H567 TaxID=1697043 RepID=UPI00081C97DF|nr:amylo-alpha-1,6-glucosidase [Bordetella sp. H567]AOB30697.1 glycogen debranching protein [Bordetella sp. H567]
MDDTLEWLEADGRGGYASGTACGLRTRRYHALLLCATRPPAGRKVLVNGVEAWVEGPAGREALTRQCYAPDLVVPADAAAPLSFDLHPWPTWLLRLKDGRIVRMACFVDKATGSTVLRWRQEGGGGPLVLKVRPLLSGRDYHALHRENPAFDFSAAVDGQRVRWRPYGDVPAITAHTNGRYAHEPDWYRNFCYVRERERGLDDIEDLATPGVFTFDLADAPAFIILAAGAAPDAGADAHGPAADVRSVDDRSPDADGGDAAALAERLAAREAARRAAFPDRLRRAADAYLVRRTQGLTLVAGYPWFTDWGRDTFIAMRGLLLATGRLDEARAILVEWTRYISQGMLPNHFPDDGGEPAYNSVDASLWFVIAAHEYLETGHADEATQARLRAGVQAILAGYAAGTRHGIGADGDGLLRAGCEGMQLTWMDAKVGDWVVTPRIGKPVEVEALWINALRIAGAWDPAWRGLEARAGDAFLRRFPKPDGSGLYDIVDANHEPGRVDGSIRPNQVFALGGLPYPLLEGPLAAAVLAQVERDLLTPLGLRTLAPADARYIGHYQGGLAQRDAAYHQGTAWPWLMGPFLQAWLRLRAQAGTLDHKALDDARARWLAPLYRHLDEGGLDHVSEIADGDAPHRAAGAPFQAWSLGELLRMEAMLRDAVPRTVPKE